MRCQRVWSVLLVLICLLPGGVFGQDVVEPRWPERVKPEHSAYEMGAIVDLDATHGLRAGRVGASLRTTEEEEVAAAALLGVPGEGSLPVEFEGAGSFIFRLEPAPVAGARKRKPPFPPGDYFVFVSGEQKDPQAPVRIQRTWFGYFPPRAGAEGETRVLGLALLMPGMFGTPEPILELFTRELQGRGWGVVRMMSQPSRFTERAVFEVDLLSPLASVTKLAAEMNTRVAEAAYAAEAAMAHVAAEHGEYTGKPRVAVGMSGGAMILPTVVAREPERYAAAVVIAGGANFFAMSDESNYKQIIGAADFEWTPREPTEEERRIAYELYLKHAPLDAFHTAVKLSGKPMLLIHGEFDGAVPARLGDLLWERLGKPERWVEQAGHEEVFMKLPGRMAKILDWLEKSAGMAPGEPETAAPDATRAAPPR
jgi:hypothetical protein